MNPILRVLLLLLIFFSPSVTHGKTVTLATLDWPPYIGPNLKNNGYVAEIARAAFGKVGYTTIINFMPWVRAEELTTKGTQDGLFPEYYSKSRAGTHIFSDPFPGGPMGFVKRVDHNIYYDDLTDLSDYRIGVVRGYINTEAFDNATYLQKKPVTSDMINFRKLLHNRIDLAISDKFVFHYLMQLHEPDRIHQLEFMEPPLEEKDLYIAFSKNIDNHQELLTAFNLGLKLLRKSGELAEILKNTSL